MGDPGDVLVLLLFAYVLDMRLDSGAVHSDDNLSITTSNTGEAAHDFSGSLGRIERLSFQPHQHSDCVTISDNKRDLRSNHHERRYP